MFVLAEIAALAATTCAAPASAAPVATLCTASVVAYPPIRTGGWSPVDTDDQGVQAAAAFAAGELGSELASVEAAQRQAVAGTNYRLTLALEDGRRFNVQVFRALNGTFSLTSSEEAPAPAEPTED